jgi:hypothetical protein
LPALYKSLPLIAALALPTIAAASGCAVPDLGFAGEQAMWKPLAFSPFKRDTRYALVQDEGRTVLRGEADGAASLYAAVFKQALPMPLGLAWRWKTDALVAGADNRDRYREDTPLRVIAAFDGDRATLPAAEQKRLKRAERLSGHAPPFAMLMYVWSDHVPVGTVIPSAHTSQIKMLVVSSGKEGLGQWQNLRRDLGADYRRAFGGVPGPLLGVAVMTDTDNTGGRATGYYADLELECVTN